MVLHASPARLPLPESRNEVVRPEDVFDGRDFAQALTHLRTLAGLSVRDVARATGIPAATLGGYFSGRHLPSRPKQGLLPILRVCGSSDRDEERWIEALARARRSPGPRAHDVVQPYPGLRSFEVADAEWFFGREQITQRLVDCVNAAFDDPTRIPIVVITGSSGSGKSSLARAGLLPVFDTRTIIMTPGISPVAELAAQLAEACGRSVAEVEADIRHRASNGAGPNLRVCGSPVLMLVDQFEELFAPAITEVERATFLAALEDLTLPCSDKSARVVTVLVLRSDFYRQASDEPLLRRALQDGQVLVGSMSVPELRSAIVEPAHRVGITVDDDLVERVLRDMAAFGGRSAAHDPGALPLMAHALMETWRHTCRGRLTSAEYLRTGGIEHAAQQTAESLYLALDDSSQAITRRIFLRLVQVEESVPLTRRRARRTELLELSDEPDQVERVLERFIDARLLTSDTDELNLSHESLLLAWPRLAEWIASDLDSLRRHRQLTSAAQLWDTERRDEDALWRGLRLEDIGRWLDADSQRAVDLNRTEREFLAASSRLEEGRQADIRHRMRRTRHLLVAVSAFAVLACLLAAIAGVSWARSNRAEYNAMNQRNLAQSRQLAIEAAQLEGTDPALASQLALAGYTVSPTIEARSALLDSLATPTPTRLLGQPGPTTIALSHNGSLFGVGNAVTGSVELYRHPAGQPVPVRVGTVPGGGKDAQVFAQVFAPQAAILATGGQDHLVRLWDVSNPAKPRLLGSPLGGIADAVESIAFSPDGRTLAAGGGGHVLLLWDVTNPAHPDRLSTLTGLKGVVQTVCFSPDGTTLVAGGHAGLLRQWRLGRSVTPLPSLVASPPLTATVNSVAFSPDGSLLAAGSTDSVVRVWRTVAGRVSAPVGPPLIGFTNWVNAVAFSPDGGTLTAGGSDNKVLSWKVSSWQQLGTLPHPGPVTGLAYLPDGSRLLTGSADGTARLWPLPGPVLAGAQANVFTLDFSRNRVLAIGTAKNDHAVRLWQLGDPVKPIELGHAVPPRGSSLTGAAAISADSHWVSAGDQNGAVYLWNAADPRYPQLIATLTGLHSIVEWLTFSPDSRLLAAASDDATVQLWDLSQPGRPRPLSTLRQPTGYVFSVAFSPDGRTLAAAGADQLVRLWDVSKPSMPKLLDTLDAFQSYVYSVAFSPDGNLLAAGSADHSIRLWNIRQPGHPVLLGTPLTGPNNTVFSLAFSPQSQYLAAGSTDGTVRTWDVRRPAMPAPLAVLRAAGSDVFVVSFSPDGSTLAAGGAGRDVHLWPADPGKAIAALCRNAGDPITRQEWSEYAHDLPYRPPCG
jgi:WD40 repeat protein/transcriptional regulator with XRE-family HTH domain